MKTTFHQVCISNVKVTHAGSVSLSFLRKPRTFLVRFFSPVADEGKGRDGKISVLFFSFKLAFLGGPVLLNPDWMGKCRQSLLCLTHSLRPDIFFVQACW